MKNYQKVNVPAGEARVELHDSLNLTGAEVSISNLPAGAGVPFVHSHKQNEEIYAVLSGRGTMVVDGRRPLFPGVVGFLRAVRRPLEGAFRAFDGVRPEGLFFLPL